MKEHSDNTTPSDNASPANPTREIPSPYRKWMGYLTLLVLVAIFIGFWQFSENLIETLDRQAAEITQLRVALEQQEELVRLIAARSLNVVFLKATKEVPEGFGTILWDPETRAAFLQIGSLPRTPETGAYQLWATTKSHPVPLTTFIIAEGRENVRMFMKLPESASDIQGFSVTLQPTGENSVPSEIICLQGDISPGHL